MDSILKSIREFFKKLTRRERIRLVVLAIFIIALSVAVSLILGRVTYGILYTGLTADEAGQIMTELQGMGVDAQAQGTGTILVPEGQVSELRMTLASMGYQTGGFDYSLFDQASGFGMTDLEKQTLIQYQTAAHIRTQLLMMNKITDCLVILSLPKESLFALSGDGAKASASVTLVVAGGATLTQSEVNAVAETVLDAVSGLEAENLSISDANMTLYRVGGEDDLSGNVTSQLAFKQSVQSVLQEQALNVTRPIFGVDAIRISVNAVLDFSSKVSESIEFAPPVDGETDGLAVSAYNLWEASRVDGEAAGIVGTDPNGMGTEEYPYGELEDGELYEQRISEINYELNRTTTQIRDQGYSITDLSVAISIDSQKVAEDYSEAITNLVSRATGVDPEYISVERLPFEDTRATIAEELAAQEEFMREMQIRGYIEQGIKWALITILAVIFLLFVRSIVRSARRPETGGNIDYMAAEGILPGMEDDTRYEDIEISRPENIVGLEKMIDKDAGTVAQLLRNWITDE